MSCKVRHSQSVSSPSLNPWVAAEASGSVICAHCTCMAGLGEACFHIAAFLFAVYMRTRMLPKLACTSVPCRWLSPSMQQVGYKPIADIDFMAPHAKRRSALFSAQTESQQGELLICRKCVAVPAAVPTAAEMNGFYDKLAQLN